MIAKRFQTGVLVGLLAAAGAAGQTWDGGSPLNSNWSSPQNWNPNGVPTNDGSADLVFAGSARLSPVMDADWWVTSISFATSAQAFTIGGSFELHCGNITNHSPRLQTISVGSIANDSGITWNAEGGPLRFSTTSGINFNTMTITGAFDTTIAGDGFLEIRGTEITKSGSGVLILESGAFNLPISVSQGTLRLGSAANIGVANSVTLDSAGTLDMNGTNEDLGRLIGNGAAINNNGYLAVGGDDSSFTLEADISGSGELRKSGAGTITLGLMFSTACPKLIVNAGTLVANGRIDSDAVALAVDAAATLTLGNATAKFGSLEGGGRVDTGGKVLTVGGNDASTRWTGNITGAGSLVKKGNGRLNLANQNSYSGGTTIQDGVLLANNSAGSAVGAGLVSIESGGVLGGEGSVSGTVHVGAGGRIAPGGTESVTSDAGKLTLGSDCSFSSSSAFDVQIGGHVAGAEFDQLAVAGLATLSSAKLNVSLIDGFVPAVGGSWTVLTCGSRSGAFAAGAMPAGFRVRTLGATAIQVRYDCPGDVDNNRVVNQDDIDAVLFNYGAAVEPGRDGDLDFNGVVNQDDIDIVLFYYGSSCA